MNAEEIARFLRSHPQFFDQHPELLESILVPHPYGGRAIPLAERQAVALRDKARLLEGRLGELIKFGEENDAISEKVHRLAVALVGARDFPALAHSLYFHLREDFAVPHVALRVWGKSVPADFTEAEAVDDAQRQLAAALGAAQSGSAAPRPFIPRFPEAAGPAASVGLVPAGDARGVDL